MHALEVIKMKFDPEQSENTQIREIFSSRTATVLWCLIRAGHVTPQDFNEDILEISKELDESRSEWSEDFDKFLKKVWRLSHRYGRATIYDALLRHETCVDNEFWADVYRALVRNRCFRIDKEIPVAVG